MNVPSSPRFYAIVSRSSVPPTRSPDPFSLFNNPLTSSSSTKPGTPASNMFAIAAHHNHFTQLSPILPDADPSRWQNEALPNPRSVGQTPSPENNHWLNIGDRFIFLGGDDEDFKPFIVEATHRAALVPFEAKASHRLPGTSNPTEHYFPYVEAARVFINPGKPWFRVLSLYESMAQARDLGVPKRKWLFLDGRDQPTRDTPTELGRRKASEFVQAVLGYLPDDPGEWEVVWEMMAGTTEGGGIRGGWSWKEDLRFGFIWPSDVGTGAVGHMMHGVRPR